MKNKYRISVIIPCYNAEQYIVDALNSLERQTYKDFEVIIINDGSNDGSLDRINLYKINSNLKINVFTQKNSGVSVARNVGIKKCQGEYFCFLDADDICSPVYIENMIRNAEKGKFVFSYYGRNLIEIMSVDGKIEVIDKMPYKDLVEFLIYRNKPISFCNVLYNSDIVNKEHIMFSEDLRYGEDSEFMWKYVANMQCGCFINAPLYGYRIVSTSASYKKTDDVLDALKGIKRAIVYSKDKSNEVYDGLNGYMIARIKIAIAKQFIQQGNYKSYKRFIKNEWSHDDYKKIKNSREKNISLVGKLIEINCTLLYILLFVAIKLRIIDV